MAKGWKCQAVAANIAPLARASNAKEIAGEPRLAGVLSNGTKQQARRRAWLAG